MRILIFLLGVLVLTSALSKSDRKSRKHEADSTETAKKKVDTSQEKVTTEEATEPLNYPPTSITKENIKENEEIIDDGERKFEHAALAYITPWNGRGYDLAKWAAKKFTHIAPVWLQMRPQTADMAASCRIEGTHDIDHGWMNDVRSNNSAIKFVPRVLFEHWSSEEMHRFLGSEAWTQRCLQDLLHFLQRNQFDGAVIEIWMSAMMQSRGGATNYLIETLNNWGEAFHEKGMQIIAPVGPPLNDKNEVTGIFTKEMLESLPLVDYLQVMTYDFPGGRGVAPYDWVHETIRVLTQDNPRNAERLMIGMNHYGYRFVQAGESAAIQRNQFLEELEQEGAKFEWDDTVKEHRVVTEEAISYYPTLTSIELRLNLAKKYGVGIGIWELGQGMHYWTQLL
ncbi:unnamed protein product, partial [Mesorhabditis belari]|uniref:Chitinase domain-containing protein 1 n=1 Tax=Mesorhabditis belari TaxID=2138241 RepID=A0AAF3FMN2_9BILA